MKKNRIIPGVVSALVLASVIAPQVSFAAENVGTTRNMPTGEQVVNYWTNYKSNAQNKMNYNGVNLAQTGRNIDDANTYKVQPKDDGTNKGELKQEVKDDTLHLINTYRYMTGLSEVKENKDLSDKAQAGAYIGYLNDDINHFPATPEKLKDQKVIEDGKLATSESNLALGYGSSYDSIKAYMDDEDPGNIQKVGHRRWLTNAEAKEVGIGQVGSSNAVYVASDSNMAFNSKEVVVYPANNTISDFIDPTAPFSAHFGRDFQLQSANGITVTVKNTKTGETKTYTSGNGLGFDGSGIGNGSALIFGPELSKEVGTQYRVSISGLKFNGKDYPVVYDVNFISKEQPGSGIDASKPDKPNENEQKPETGKPDNNEQKPDVEKPKEDDKETEKPNENEQKPETGKPNENEQKPKEDENLIEFNSKKNGKIFINVKSLTIQDEKNITNNNTSLDFEILDSNKKQNDSLRQNLVYLIKETTKDEKGNTIASIDLLYDGELVGNVKVKANVVKKPQETDKPKEVEKPTSSIVSKPKVVEENKDKKKEVKKVENKKDEKESKNVESKDKVKTGVAGTGIVAGILASALAGYKISKKK